ARAHLRIAARPNPGRRKLALLAFSAPAWTFSTLLTDPNWQYRCTAPVLGAIKNCAGHDLRPNVNGTFPARTCCLMSTPGQSTRVTRARAAPDSVARQFSARQRERELP